MIESSKKTSPSVGGTPLRLCSIDFSQGDFNTKDRNRQYTSSRRQQRDWKPKPPKPPKQPQNNPLENIRKLDEIYKTDGGEGPLSAGDIADASKASLESVVARTKADTARNAREYYENKSISDKYRRSEERREKLGENWGKVKDAAKEAFEDPGAAVDKVTTKSKKFLFGDGQQKGLAKALKETKDSLDTTVSRIAYGKDLDPKKKGDQKKLQKITGESVGEKGVKKAYKEVGKDISSNISAARDIGTGIHDAINPNAKFKRIAKYGKGVEVSRVGRAISRGDTRLGEGLTSKIVGGILQKGGSSAMQKKATKDYERKQTLKSMRGFSEEEMLAYNEIFKALIEEDFTTVKPGDQSEKPISEEVLKELIDTNFYEANDSEEKKYHESVVKGYSFDESTGRYESLSREIFGEA